MAGLSTNLSIDDLREITQVIEVLHETAQVTFTRVEFSTGDGAEVVLEGEANSDVALKLTEVR